MRIDRFEPGRGETDLASCPRSDEEDVGQGPGTPSWTVPPAGGPSAPRRLATLAGATLQDRRRLNQHRSGGQEREINRQGQRPWIPNHDAQV